MAPSRAQSMEIRPNAYKLDLAADTSRLERLPQSPVSEVEEGFYHQPPKRAWYDRLLDTIGLMPLRHRNFHTYEPSRPDSPGAVNESKEQYALPSATSSIPRRRAVIGMLKGACIVLPIIILVLL